MKRTTWRVIASSYVIDSKFLRLRKDAVELPDGTRVEDYYVRESRGFAVIFAQTPEDEIVLVRQYKHGIGRSLVELPAGAIDAGESAQDAAVRELAEETGYTAERLEHVRSYVTDPTNSNAVAHLFFAHNARQDGRQRLDVTENITVELASRDELLAMVRDGTIDCMPHVAAVYVMLDRLGHFPETSRRIAGKE